MRLPLSSQKECAAIKCHSMPLRAQARMPLNAIKLAQKIRGRFPTTSYLGGLSLYKTNIAQHQYNY